MREWVDDMLEVRMRESMRRGSHGLGPLTLTSPRGSPPASPVNHGDSCKQESIAAVRPTRVQFPRLQHLPPWKPAPYPEVVPVARRFPPTKTVVATTVSVYTGHQPHVVDRLRAPVLRLQSNP